MPSALYFLLLFCCVVAGYGLLLTTGFYLGAEESFEEIRGEYYSEFLAGRYFFDLIVGLILIAAYFILEWLIRFFSEAHYPIGCRNVRFRTFVAWVCLCVILLPPIFWGWLQ